MVDNVRLPVGVESGAVGGPRFQTQVQVAISGQEQRIADWDQARGEWDISYGIRTIAELTDVIKLFRARSGRLEAFRFKDWSDYAVTGQVIGTGDGVEDTYRLFKSYTDTVNTHNRAISHPISGTVTIYVNGVAKMETTHYVLNYETGFFIFTGGNIPTVGQSITADFEFDVPVRFDSDHLKVSMVQEDIGEIPPITITEVLDE